MAETPIRFAKGSAVWCQTTPVNYHDAVVLEDCVEGDAEAVVRYTTAARVMRVAVDKVIPIGDARPRRSTTKAPVPAVSPARAPAAPRRQRPAPKRRLSRDEKADLEQLMRRDQWTTTKTGRDPYYSKPGESKQYRSLLEIARAHYPDVLHVPLDSLQMLSPPYNGCPPSSPDSLTRHFGRRRRRSTPTVSDDDAEPAAAGDNDAAELAAGFGLGAAAAEPAAADDDAAVEPAAVDEPAAADAEPAAEAVQPAAAAPAAESGDSAPAFAVEALVEARFRGGVRLLPGARPRRQRRR